MRFEGQSFHEPRRIQVELEGRPHGVLELSPSWQTVEIDLPSGDEIHRVTLIADGCVSPAEVGEGEDDRCLAFQVRNFKPRRFELYDLVVDPMAERDLFRDQPKIRRRLRDRLLAFEWEPRGEAGERLLSVEDEETLRALGYLD